MVAEEGFPMKDYDWKENGPGAEEKYIDLSQNNESQSDDM